MSKSRGINDPKYIVTHIVERAAVTNQWVAVVGQPQVQKRLEKKVHRLWKRYLHSLELDHLRLDKLNLGCRKSILQRSSIQLVKNAALLKQETIVLLCR